MADEKAKRGSVCKKVFLDAAGDERRSASVDAVQLEFRFTDADVISVKLSDFSEEMQTCFSWYGLSQKFGDAYAGVKGDVADGIEEFESMMEQIISGTWVTEATAGIRPSMVCDAIVAALEANGEKVDDERRDAIREKIKDPEKRKGATADPAVKAQLEKIKADRAVTRAKDAAKKAKGQVIGVTGF